MSDYTIKALYTAKPAENMNNVTVNGWVRTMRESKTFAFVELNDGTYFKNLQIILDEAVLADYRALYGGSIYAYDCKAVQSKGTGHSDSPTRSCSGRRGCSCRFWTFNSGSKTYHLTRKRSYRGIAS